jgi:hypothetical protein
VYTASDSALGVAHLGDFPAGLRHHLLCLGLFLDLGGRDVYPVPRVGTNKRWFHRGEHEAERGLGIDGVYPAFSFPRF